MKNVCEILAENIKRRRKELGMTQKELADRLGYSEKAISKWESGRGAPPTAILPQLASVLEESLDRLLREQSGIRFYLGIDGGGTKTEFVLADDEGNILKSAVLGASNPNDIGMSAALEVLREGIVAVAGKYAPGEISVYAGLAGGASFENKEKIAEFLSRFGFGAVKNGNDAQNAVAAALGDRDGVVVIMGTGSIAYAQSRGELYRVGGFGILLGDEGSGFSFGKDALLAALRYEDGSAEKTMLYELVKKKLETDNVLAKLGAIYEGGKRMIASLAPLVFEACRQKDAVAEGILEKNIRAIAALALGAAKHIDGDTVKVSLCGGLCAERAVILPTLEKILAEREPTRRFEIEICDRSLVSGAILLAKKNAKNKKENGYA